MHLEQTADTLFLVLAGVEHIGARIERAGINTQIGELTNERVGHDLECERCEGALRICGALFFFVGLRVDALDRRNIERRRHVVDNRVEQFLNTLVLVGRANEDRVDLALDGTLADSCLELLDRNFLFHEDLFHQVVVAISRCFEQHLAALFSNRDEFIGNGIHRLRIGHALIVCLEVPCGHGNEVDDAPEVVLSAHRDLSSNSRCMKTIMHGVDSMEEIGANTIVLVDVSDAWNAIAGSLTPYGLGLRLNASNRVEDRNRTVKNAQGALDFCGEVNVTRGVDDLEAVLLTVLLPEARGSCSGDGYAALLLLNHPVHGGSTVVDLTDLVGLAGVVENTFGSGGLTSIDVGHDADVTSVFET